jgi:arginase family enzyme
MVLGSGRARPTALVTARELHRGGVEAVLARIPIPPRFYLPVDIDVLDSSIAAELTVRLACSVILRFLSGLSATK